MKRKAVLLLSALLACVSMSGCKKNNNDPNAYSLNYEKSNGGYYVTVSRFGHVISTRDGSIGVRFDKNDFRADEPIYANYTSVEKVDNGLLAKGEISSAYGSTISFVDHFSLISDRLLVNRYFSVKSAGEDRGFMVEQKWIDSDTATIYDKEWFIPASVYSNGDHKFENITSRMFFDGETVTFPAEDVSALIASSLYKGFSFSLMDTTPGYRETSVDDRFTAEGNYLYIGEEYNYAGITLYNTEDNKVAVSHVFPSNTRISRERNTFRLLPVKEGLSRNISFEIFLNKFDSFNDMYQTMWNKAYSYYQYADKRYQLNDVYKTLREFVRRSYSATNIWGNIPQYMTNADHFFPDSGFLYRNIEMATFMMKYGKEINDATVISNALTVINYQIDNDCIDSHMRAYSRDNNVFKRVLFDGLASVVDLYEYLVTSKYEDKALVNKIHNYIIKKAELYKADNSLLSISFYSRLYLYRNILYLDYQNRAIELAEKITNQTKCYGGYYGAIENSDPDISVAEDYMLLLRGLMNVYEATHNHRYLKEAERLGYYLQTFSVIQPINMNPIGTTGAEGFYNGFLGNERFLGYGYSFNNTNHHILDCPTISSTIECYKLYKYTKNNDFKNYLETKLYNALIYVNMGDKVGYMDDPLHSAGEGFINEFAGSSVVKENYPEGGVRGAVHDSIIGWNICEILYAFEYLKNNNYEGFNADYKLTHNLAKNRVISIEKDNVSHSVYNVINGLDETYYVNNSDSEFIIDLNEHSFIENIEVISDQSVSVHASNDGINFVKLNDLSLVNQKARYVKFEVAKDNKVTSIHINGCPVKYENLSCAATIVDESGSMSSAIDKSNYVTSWNAGDNQSEHVLLLDLKEEMNIYQTAIMFSKISKYSYVLETSIDGVNYTKYCEDDGAVDKYLFVNEQYVSARYVKLTIKGSSESTILVKDFKVMGSAK